MNLQDLGPEVNKFLDTLKSAFQDRAGSNPPAFHQSSIDQDALWLAILALLTNGPQAADEVQLALAQLSAGTWKPAASQIFPALDELCHSELASFEIVESKKMFAITPLGIGWLGEKSAKFPGEQADGASNQGDTGGDQKGPAGWSNLPFVAHATAKTAFAKSGAMLTQAIGAVLASGSPVVFDEAAVELNAAAKAIFAIISKTE